MIPRFVYPSPSGAPVYDADAETYFAAVVTAGGAALDATHKQAVSDLVTALKGHSLWTKLDGLWLFANQHATAALIDIKGLRTATAVNSPTFTADQGYAGNGSTSYVNTTFNPSSHGSQYTQNSAHLFFYDRTSRTTDSPTSTNCGNYNGSNNLAAIGPRPGGTSVYWVNDAAGITASGPANIQGCWIASRTSSTATALYRNGSSFASSGAANSVGLVNLAMFVGALNNNGSPADFTSDQHAVFGVGAGLNGTEAANLNTDIEAYMDALGTGVQ
jgi:hypothetical protein